jgi:tetratricopeptide (TPR) repeat protein
MIKKILLIIIVSVFSIASFSQVGIIKDPERKKEYKKVIEQANQLFENKQYTASIHFYKKALVIGPEKKLAKYRLEDIKTIFIKDELASNKEEAEALVERINKTVKEIEENLPEEKKDSLIYFLSDMDTKKTEPIDSRPESWVSLENEIRNEINSEATVVGDEPVEKVKVEIVKEPDVIIEEDPHVSIELLEKEEPVEETKYPVIKSEDLPEKSSTDLQTEREKIEEELKQKYPDQKTVEIINEKHKKITKVIMNRDNKITVYLKVEHDWGGVFYFIDRRPFPVQSITKNYFIRHTLVN